jgi:hypothetical protein
MKRNGNNEQKRKKMENRIIQTCGINNINKI